MKISKIKEIIDEVISEEMGEGFGYVYAKDRAKDPKSIPGEHWRIKFQSAHDLKKHGNTEKSKVSEIIYEIPRKIGINAMGDEIGRTSTDEGELRNMIGNMKPGQSILFHGKEGIKGPLIYIVKREGIGYEVENHRKQKQEITNADQLDLIISGIAKQANILFRFWKQNKPSTYSAPKLPVVSKEQIREIIKELIDEMWIAWEEDKNDNKDITESKYMNNKKEFLRDIIREAIQEVEFEDAPDEKYQEEQEILSMKRIQSYAHWIKENLKDAASEIGGVIQKIVTEIDGLVSAHEKGKEISPVNVHEVAPPGWEGTVKAMKKHSVGGAKRWAPKKKKEETVDVEEAKKKKKITNPYKLAWWMKGKGYKSHKQD